MSGDDASRGALTTRVAPEVILRGIVLKRERTIFSTGIYSMPAGYQYGVDNKKGFRALEWYLRRRFYRLSRH
jgi:hypothetical protein